MQFSKMHGLSNDFMVVDCITQNVFFSPEIIKILSDRYSGIGFDQLLLVEPPYNPNIDFHYRIFNADGNEVYQCGNGVRCFAQFVRIKKLINKNDFYVSTRTSHMLLSIIDNELVRVNMGEPNFNPEKIPFIADEKALNNILNFNSNMKRLCGVVSIGNPHCVIIVDNIKTPLFNTICPILENHEYFPEKINVGFMQIINREHILLRVYERGIGETKACGSGACAAVALGIKQGLLSEQVQVDLIGGTLLIKWNGLETPLYMTGPAVHVYDGFIDINQYVNK